MSVFLCEVLTCLLYTSDAADERSSVDLGGRRIIKKKKNTDMCVRGTVRTHKRVQQSLIYIQHVSQDTREMKLSKVERMNAARERG